MSYKVFPALQFSGSISKRFFFNIWCNLPEIPSYPALFFVESFLIIDSVSLLIIILHIFYISSVFSPGRLCVLGICLFHPGYSIC